MADLIYNDKSVVIRSAVLDNTLTLVLRHRIHRALDGTFWSYKSYPTRRVLNVSFEYLNRNKIVEVEAFLLASRGQWIMYKDHADRVYTVKIKTTSSQFNHAAVRNNQFSLEMEVAIA